MILIYLNTAANNARIVYEKIKNGTDIPVKLVIQENILKDGQFYLEYINNELVGSLKAADDDSIISTKDVKICYIAQQPYVIDEWLPFQNEFDLSYAKQEWWASISAMLLTQRHIKFVNPFWAKWDLYSEMEQLLLFQKFDISTVEMVVTNNPQEAIKYYNLWDRNVIFKSVRTGYDMASKMDIPDLARIEKLKLSPAIFQKAMTGQEINVCLIGKYIMANSFDYSTQIPASIQVDIPEDLKNKLVSLSEFINMPTFTASFIYVEPENKYYAYTLNAYPDFETTYMNFGNAFVESLTQYLIEEYKKMILLIGEGEKEMMSQYLLENLQSKQIDVIWVDQNTIPVENTITFYSEDGKVKGNINFHEKITIDIEDIDAIYTRLSLLNPEIALSEQDKDFLQAERSIAIDFWLEHTDTLVINPIKSQRSNGSKLYQNWIVQQYGFKIPDCLISSNPERAKKFIMDNKDKGVIYKSASAERSKVCIITEEDLDRLEGLISCPTLFQSLVPGTDIRIHALATGEIFATEILSESSDYRYDKDRTLRAIELPENLKNTCVQITRDLGLYISGIDTRRSPEGDYYCFEVNPSPAYAWYEDQSGQPITEAVANMLIQGKELVKSNLVQRKF